MSQTDEPISTEERRPKTKDIDVVNLNTAGVEELSRLPGIAEKLAGRIVEYRTKVHPFRETAEIIKVRGISAAMYEGIADLLTVGPAEAAPWVEPEAPVLPLPEAEPELPVEAEAPVRMAEPEEPVVEVSLEEPAAAAEPEAPAVAAQELPPAPPARRARPRPAPEPRRGIGWPALLGACLVSAIAGAGLALLLLWAVNGTLKFGPSDTVSALRADLGQLDGRAGQLSAGLDQVQGRLDQLDRGVAEMDGLLNQVDGRLAAAQAGLNALNEEVTRVGGDVQTFQDRFRAIEAQFKGLTEDLQAVRQSARRFDVFLAGLRELLNQGQEPALNVTPLPSKTQVPLAPTSTRKPGLTVVPQPTLTPKP